MLKTMVPAGCVMRSSLFLGTLLLLNVLASAQNKTAKTDYMSAFNVLWCLRRLRSDGRM